MSVADTLVERFAPWLTEDLETYLAIGIGGMFAEIELLTEDDDVHDGWTILFDVARAREQDLPYFAQAIGERLPVGIGDRDAREWIDDAPNSRRGTIMSIVRAAQRTLTGGRLVSIRERFGPDGADDDAITIVTYTDETPYPDIVLRDLQAVVPADLALTYQNNTGELWEDVRTGYASWAAVEAGADSWEEIAAAQVGYSTYTRPR